MLQILLFLKNFASVFFVGVLFFISITFFSWGQPSWEPSKELFVFGFLHWVFNGTLFMLAMALFRSVALPERKQTKSAGAMVFLPLLILGGLFVYFDETSSLGVAKRYYSARKGWHDRVASSFVTGNGYFAKGFSFVPGKKMGSEYTNSILLAAVKDKKRLFLGVNISITSNAWHLRNGWQIDKRVRSHSKSSFSFPVEKMLYSPPAALRLVDKAPFQFSVLLMSWVTVCRGYNLPVIATYIEALFFVVGMFLFVFGLGRICYKPDMPLFERFYRWLSFFLFVVVPIFLIHFGWGMLFEKTSIAPLVVLFMRGGVMFVVGIVFVKVGARRTVDTENLVEDVAL